MPFIAKGHCKHSTVILYIYVAACYFVLYTEIKIGVPSENVLEICIINLRTAIQQFRPNFHNLSVPNSLDVSICSGDILTRQTALVFVCQVYFTACKLQEKHLQIWQQFKRLLYQQILQGSAYFQKQKSAMDKNVPPNKMQLCRKLQIKYQNYIRLARLHQLTEGDLIYLC